MKELAARTCCPDGCDYVPSCPDSRPWYITSYNMTYESCFAWWDMEDQRHDRLEAYVFQWINGSSIVERII